MLQFIGKLDIILRIIIITLGSILLKWIREYIKILIKYIESWYNISKLKLKLKLRITIGKRGIAWSSSYKKV